MDLFLHIGHPKTGTSTIQSMIAQKADELVSAGFLIANKHGEFSTSGPFVPPPVGWISAHGQAGDLAEAMAQSLNDAIAKARELGASRLLMSAENISSNKQKHILDAVQDGVTIHFIYYVRAIDDWIISAWKQWHSKSGADLINFVETKTAQIRSHYRHVIERFSAHPCFGSFYVRPLHRAGLKNGNLLADFANAIGWRDDFDETIEEQNVSPDFELTTLLAGNPGLFEHSHDNRIEQFLVDRGAADFQRQQRDPLGAELRSRIFAKYEAEYRWLHETYFPHVDFDTVFPNHSEKWAVEPQLPTDRDLIFRSFGSLMKVTMEQQQEIQALKVEIERLKRK